MCSRSMAGHPSVGLRHFIKGFAEDDKPLKRGEIYHRWNVLAPVPERLTAPEGGSKDPYRQIWGQFTLA